METIRILLVDDELPVRRALRMRLQAENELSVVGEASNGAAAVQLALELKPDVVVMDVRMPVLGGIEATAEIKAVLPAVKVLVLTMHDSAAVRAEAERAGASKVLAKDLVEEALLPAIVKLIKERS